MKCVQFVTAVHGNEPMPVLALAANKTTQVVANPRALALGKRFIECDLNAAFGVAGEAYEQKRATELARVLNPEQLVVDLHTFSCESEPFTIIVDLKMLPLARMIGVRNVVYMKHNIKAGHALINYFPGVSVEVGHHTDPKAFTLVQEIVSNLHKNIPRKIRIYEVFGRIEEKGNYVNFCKNRSFVPVLYGERAYDNQNFYGLKAREITGTI